MMMRAVAIATAALLGLAGAPASAQEKFPAKPVEMVIPTPPGGGTDIALRMLAELTEPILGQKVVVVNKPGGGGTVGMSTVVQGRPDGYTIAGVWNAPLTMTPHMLPTPYKTSDYATVAFVTSAPALFCVKKDFPANTGQEFVEELKRNPNKHTYGNDGIGGTLHLSAERIFGRMGAKARAVPFGGAGETLKAYLGGHVDIYAGSISPILPYVREGTTKCLLLTTAARVDTLPQAAGLADLGIPEEETVLWRGILAPKTIPADRLAVLEAAFMKAANSDKFRAFMAARGEQGFGRSSADLRKQIDTEYEAIGKIMADLGLSKK